MPHQHPRCEQCSGCLSDFDDGCKAYVAQRASLFQNSFSAICGLTFTIGGFFQGTEVRTVTVTETAAEIASERRLFPPNDSPLFTLSLEKSVFTEALEKIGIGGWLPSYFDPHIMDGTQWGLEIRFSDETPPFTCHGSNAYPETFNALCILLGFENADYKNFED